LNTAAMSRVIIANDQRALSDHRARAESHSGRYGVSQTPNSARPQLATSDAKSNAATPTNIASETTRFHRSAP
jgi:hypothetical protein